MRPTATLIAGSFGVMRLPLFIFVILSLSAGRVTWDRMWILLSLMGVGLALALPVLARRNPALLAERFRKRASTEPFDKRFAALSAPLLGGLLVLAGLDGSRYLWSGLPAWTVVPGVLLHIVGYLFVVWVLSANPHAEGTVRIQTDRGHRVITGGPYRFVRHPMYTGMLLMFAGWPLILGSLWAFAPLAALVALFVWRTAREDRTLQEKLAGYTAYSTHTRYRLLPRVW